MPSLSLIIAVPPFLISNILGGRPDWYVYSMRNWSIWSYFISYFPIKLIKTADIPPNKVDKVLSDFAPNCLLHCFCYGSWIRSVHKYTEYLKDVMQGKLIAVAYTLRTYRNQFSLG